MASVITDTGVEMMNQFASGQGLTITAVRSGSGTVEEVNLWSQTALQKVEQDLKITSQIADEKSMTLIAGLTNEGLASAYTLNQLGVYAKIDGGSEKLFAILQESDGLPIPAEGGSNLYAIDFYLSFVLTNSGDVEITIDTSAHMTIDVYNSYELTADDIDEICV